VALDIQIVQGVAPGARIAVLFAPNTEQGFVDAVADSLANKATYCGTNTLAAVSISWGGPENTWSSQALTEMNTSFASLSAIGVVVTVASGDQGSGDGESGNNVDFPSSSPNVLACGGTTITVSGTHITNEVVWNNNYGASGGGVSSYFAKPSYQSSINLNGQPLSNRGVPDVAGDADPNTGYLIKVKGQYGEYGGTSCVAPLWAGLTALLTQSLNQAVGPLNPVLYHLSSSADALNDITSGNNGAYSATTGWDACTGLGSPNGANLLAAL